MSGRFLTLTVFVVVLALPAVEAFGQRGGRGGARGGGGGGMQRGGGGFGGGGPGGGGGMQRGGGGFGGGGPGGGMQRGGGPSGGFGGGLSSREPQGGGMPGGGSPAMGPYGRGGAGGPGMSGAGAGRPGAGTQAGVGAGRPGVGTQPGIGAGRPGVGTQPGVGAGRPGVGTQPGIGTQPGLGAGRPGVGAGGVGGPDSGIGVRPGLGAGAPGVPGADRRYGTYYNGNNALVAQRNTVVAGGYGYPAYNPAMYAGAWQAANMMNASYYANPGYGAVASTLGVPAQPVPYDYGSNVVAQPDAVYVNGQPAGTPQQYADQAGQIAAAGGAEPDPNDQWLPLGVFAMVEGDQAQPNDLFQLAVNRQGVLRGNYHNVSTNETTPLAGSVDLKTQRAAWTIGGDQTPVYEAGLANLTQDQTTMVVHTPDGQQRQFTLVRLPEPQNSGSGAGAGAGAAPQ